MAATSTGSRRSTTTSMPSDGRFAEAIPPRSRTYPRKELMPHIVVKIAPGKTQEQKQQFTEAVVHGVKSIFGYDEDAVSLIFEEVAPDAWKSQVYEPEIIPKWAELSKRPGYEM
jgi:4-oxalocrotonate tautomerase